METVTLILPLEAMTVNNPIDSSGVTAAAVEQQLSDGGLITEK